MDSKTVDKQIRAVVWPRLRDAGFVKIAGRNTWRFQERSIDVVNFQSFNSYLAAGVGCTTFSFAVNLGVYYPCTEDAPWADRKCALPKEFDCQARRQPRKRIAQVELDRADIWYVRANGTNVSEVVSDATDVLVAEGLPWLARFDDLDYALFAFCSKPGSDEQDLSGGINSLGRAKVAASIALELGWTDVARDSFGKVLANPFYAKKKAVIDETEGWLAELSEGERKGRPDWSGYIADSAVVLSKAFDTLKTITPGKESGSSSIGCRWPPTNSVV
jgi:hypothetical protein